MQPTTLWNRWRDRLRRPPADRGATLLASPRAWRRHGALIVALTHPRNR